MKKYILFIGASLVYSQAFAWYGNDDQPSSNFNYLPNNFNNSQNNFDNSPYNFKNSPNNFNNSPYNFNSNNGIYDDRGNRMGYGVRRQDGGINYFNDDGNRMGYQPSR